MKEVLKIKVEKPQYVAITGITYAQVDSWYGHCRRDLKLDLICLLYTSPSPRDCS